MLINEYNFDLPKHLIAQSPVIPRDAARLLVYKRSEKSLEMFQFRDLPKILNSGDVIVLNDTKVFPARLMINLGDKTLEALFLEKHNHVWKCMIRLGKRFKIGSKISHKGLSMKVEGIDEDGFRYLSINISDADLGKYLEMNGEMPVPPYISGNNYKNDDYNTIYSKKRGSVAAPTAGLHFTKELINRLLSKGIIIEYVTLHVGLGTFLPVKVENVNLHKMHQESYSIDWSTANRLNRYVKQNKRIFAVGTTTVRTLEDNFARFHRIQDGDFNTAIFIKPGYNWQAINGLITNFHLPKSTLVMLVASLIGKDETMRIYDFAKRTGFRFYSFGDGMMVI